ncbi:unnamed protein product [Pleuronectes platessa]|uniref:Uncharacterized protein n=1 Tax=Pleuronectes platessa TaxID=8262 RepID=A0A9N7URX3_PLEPL|nr:unnamed protein product [Pleuronectes platessa]
MTPCTEEEEEKDEEARERRMKTNDLAPKRQSQRVRDQRHTAQVSAASVSTSTAEEGAAASVWGCGAQCVCVGRAGFGETPSRVCAQLVHQRELPWIFPSCFGHSRMAAGLSEPGPLASILVSNLPQNGFTRIVLRWESQVQLSASNGVAALSALSSAFSDCMSDGQEIPLPRNNLSCPLREYHRPPTSIKLLDEVKTPRFNVSGTKVLRQGCQASELLKDFTCSSGRRDQLQCAYPMIHR